MAKTVIEAFKQFLNESVNISSSQSSSAKSSRDWLLDNIKKFPEQDAKFPYLENVWHLNYGSFARKTKTRPLDDIDMMICLKLDGCSWYDYGWNNITINLASDYQGRLRNYKALTAYSNELNSTRIINKFVSNLSGISQYEKANIKKSGLAATLKLKTYDWNFDIVPYFHVYSVYDKRFYDLIPNGSGRWMKTDPRLDRERVTRINQACNGNVLQVIRILKYWNQRLYSYIRIPSYLLETMICDYYQIVINSGNASNVSQFVDLEIIKVLEYLKNSIYCVVNDPKGIEHNINTIGYAHQSHFHTALTNTLDQAKRARSYENIEFIALSIKEWGKIFGYAFPKYTP